MLMTNTLDPIAIRMQSAFEIVRGSIINEDDLQRPVSGKLLRQDAIDSGPNDMCAVPRGNDCGNGGHGFYRLSGSTPNERAESVKSTIEELVEAAASEKP